MSQAPQQEGGPGLPRAREHLSWREALARLGA